MPPTELHVYDFDGTLFRSTNKPPWFVNQHRWWGVNPQSLHPPCTPDQPGGDWWVSKAVAAAASSIRNPDALAVLVTGRLVAFRGRVRQLLSDRGLRFQETHFLPSGGSVKSYKVEVMTAILEENPTITAVHIWEDQNLAHYLSELRAWAGAFDRPLEVVGHPIEEEPHPNECGPEVFPPEAVDVSALTPDEAKLFGAAVRLAHVNPQLRPALLPLLRGVQAREFSSPEALKNYLKEHPKADPKNHTVKKPGPKPAAPTQSPERPSKRLFTEAEEKLPEVARQPQKDPTELFKKAEEAHEQQLDLLNRGKGLDSVLKARVVRGDKKEKPDLDAPGPVVVIGPMKNQARSEEKVKADFGGDWSRLNDVVRASVAVDSMEDVEGVMAELRKKGVKLARKPKDRFSSPTSAGYRDAMFNVVYPNGHVGEIQVHLKGILKAKDAGHKFYEEVRSISAKAKEAGRETLTEEEQKIVDEANEKMKDLYQKAWESSTKKSEKVPKPRPEKPGKKAADRVAATFYYDFNGIPAKVDARRFPTKYTPGGLVVEYDLQKFFAEATPITKSVYEALRDEMDGEAEEARGKEAQLRAGVIRLAHSEPLLRPHLLPLLKG